MKSWVKGGLIGLGVLVLVFVLILFLGEYGSIIHLFPFDIKCPFIETLTEPTLEPIMPNPLCGWFNVLIIISFWFLLGAIIGWLVGKLKKKV